LNVEVWLIFVRFLQLSCLILYFLSVRQKYIFFRCPAHMWRNSPLLGEGFRERKWESVVDNSS